MGARELLHELADAGFSIEAAGEKLVIRPASKLTDDLRAALRAAKPDLLALLTTPNTVMSGRPYGLSQADADTAHAEPWDDAACGRFVARVSLFMRRGISGTDADDLAERLHLRDVAGDDRHLCVECRHVCGRASAGWRCGNARVAGVARDLPAALVALPQRCTGFAS